MEARASVRYRFGTAAIFSWEGPSGGSLRGEGTTRDISIGGSYIVSPTCPPIDAIVKVEILLTSRNASGRSVTIVTEARVLRVEHAANGGGQSGFAVASTSKGFELLGSWTEPDLAPN
jgi:PilZ domain